MSVAFFGSIENGKFKKIFLSYFALSSLFPILISIFVAYGYIVPLLGDGNYGLIESSMNLGLSAMLFFPLISFFLMYRQIQKLESVTSEIVTKTTAVVNREERFTAQKIDEKQVSTPSHGTDLRNESEIQSLVRSFNNIFQAATDQLEERNHLRELLARLIAISSNLMAELDFDRLFPLIIGNVTDAMGAEPQCT